MTLPTPGVTPANWGAQLNAEIVAAASPLAVVVYEPASALAVSTTSSTMADLDATNLAITFTVPSSGRVLVTLDGWFIGSAGASTTYNWGLRESTATVAEGSIAYNFTGGAQIRMRLPLVVSGLTPGASLTYKWAHRLSFGTQSSGINVVTQQAATMIVNAA